jgi:hypothetical protein
VLGSAQVAGAYDLINISFPAALKGGARQHALYLAYLARGYAGYYRQPLDSVLTPPHATLVTRLFDGASPDEIVAALPADPRAMFAPGLLHAYDNAGRHWFLEAMAANSLAGVTPRAPLRLYYGAGDTDVLPAEAIETARQMQARGADVQAIDVGPVGHDDSMLAAAPQILAWLVKLDAAARPASGGAPAG